MYDPPEYTTLYKILESGCDDDDPKADRNEESPAICISVRKSCILYEVVT